MVVKMRSSLKILALGAVLVLPGLGGGAIAQPAYTSEEIVQMFIKSANLGKSRAICIGSDAECAAKVSDTVDPVNMKVNFEYDSDVLTESARETIVEFAKGINDPRLEIAKFELEGHTDAYGGDAFNMDLSSRRAHTVEQLLVSLGVDESRIISRGLGESKPVTADPFAPENRRVNARLVMPNG
jgi:OmpA-OmpF porin, OOP family